MKKSQLYPLRISFPCSTEGCIEKRYAVRRKAHKGSKKPFWYEEWFPDGESHHTHNIVPTNMDGLSNANNDDEKSTRIPLSEPSPMLPSGVCAISVGADELPPAGTALAEWKVVFELEYFKYRELLLKLQGRIVKFKAPEGAVDITARAVAEYECFSRLSSWAKQNYIVGSLPASKKEEQK